MATRVERGSRTKRSTTGQMARPARAPHAAHAGRVGAWVAALGVLALFVALHVYRLGQTPGWDPQEGYNLDIAWNLLHGRLRLFAMTSAFGQHPPLFYLQLALLMHLFGYRIVTIRALAATYALLTCATLLAFGRRLLGTGPAIWAGLAFSCAPLFLANTRWGYTYAQLMLVGLLCLWAVWRYAEGRSRRWLVVAAALAGLGVLSDYEGVALVALVVLATLRVRRRDALPAAAVALGVALAGMLACFVVAPSIFGPDLLDTFGRASGGSLALSAVELLVNYYRFVTLDVWVLLGIVGLFLVRGWRPRALLLAATGTVGLVVLQVREVGPAFHTAVPLLPLLALGAGVALDAAVRHLYAFVVAALAPRGSSATTGQIEGGGQPHGAAVSRRVPPGGWRLWRAVTGQRGRNAVAAFAVFMVVASPLAIAIAGDAAGVASTLPTRNDLALATSPADAQAVATYVLAHERPGDVTLGSPQVMWMLDQPDDVSGHPRPVFAADLLQALAYGGHAAAFYPAGLPRARWAFDVSLGHARYVVVDDLLRRLAAPGQVAGLADVLSVAQSWPAVYQRGEYVVYERPAAG